VKSVVYLLFDFPVKDSGPIVFPFHFFVESTVPFGPLSWRARFPSWKLLGSIRGPDSQVPGERLANESLIPTRSIKEIAS
jgi:hypothetical protein